MLNLDQIALATRYSTGHLYNLNSTNKLPFKISRGLGNKFFVSIVEMAAYMDKTMLSKPPEDVTSTSQVAKKKPGRPRNSTKANSELDKFLTDLNVAVEHFRAVDGLSGGPELVPLFMDSEGMVHGMPLFEPQLHDIEEFKPPHEVRWVTLEEAFAAVWRDEENRIRLLTKMTSTRPELFARVNILRNAILDKI